MSSVDTLESPDAKHDRAYWIAWAICAIAALVPIWSVKYLPMVDVPQHAVQVSIIKNLADPAYGFANEFELHWFTPYAMVYLLGRIFAQFFSIATSISLVVSLVVLGLPLAMHHLLKTVRGEVWWSLLGFPLAFGYSFYWGFVNMLVAVPLVVWALAVGIRFAEKRTWPRAAALVAITVALFFSHVYGMALAVGLVALEILLKSRSFRSAVIGLLPLSVCAAMSLLWIADFRHVLDTTPDRESVWHIGWYRFGELPGSLLGGPKDTLMTVFGVAMIVLVASAIRVKDKSLSYWCRWIPFAACLAAFLVGTPVMAPASLPNAEDA